MASDMASDMAGDDANAGRQPPEPVPSDYDENPDRAQVAAEAVELPLSVTKRGALLFARKGS
jgi:hypothetical protein